MPIAVIGAQGQLGRQVPAEIKLANGEIWTLQDAQRCRAASGCDALMLGRGMVADPGLALAIRGEQRGVSWATLLPLMAEFWRLVAMRVEPRHRAGRLKQWLNYLRRCYPQAQAAYDELRTINDPQSVARMVGLADEQALPMRREQPILEEAA